MIINVQRGAQGAGQVNPSATYQTTVTSVQEMEIEIPDGSVDLQINMDINIGRMAVFAMSSNETCEVKFNSASTPTDTISFVKGSKEEEIWRLGEANRPINTHVTTLFCGNASGQTARIQLKIGQSA